MKKEETGETAGASRRRDGLYAAAAGPHKRAVRSLVASFRAATKPVADASNALDRIDEIIGSLHLLAAALRKQMETAEVKKTDYMRFTVLHREASARLGTLQGRIGLIEDAPDPFPALERRTDALYKKACAPHRPGAPVYMDLVRDARALKEEFAAACDEWEGIREDLEIDTDGAALVLDDLGLVAEKARLFLAARGEAKPAAPIARNRKKPVRPENRFLK